MNQAIPIPIPEAAAPLHVGRVRMIVTTDGVRRLAVAGPFGLVRARRAAGCLLMPRQGDTVLLFLPDGGGDDPAYVLSVLERPEDSGELALPADTTLTARSLAIRADALSMSGRVLTQAFAAVRSLAGSVLERAARRLGLYGRQIDRVSDVRETTAGRIRVAAEDGLRMRARNADIRARNSVALDGEHVKIG